MKPAWGGIEMQKRVGLSMCGMETHEMKKEFDHAIPKWLRDHAIAHGLFGGELLLEEIHFFLKSDGKRCLWNHDFPNLANISFSNHSRCIG